LGWRRTPTRPANRVGELVAVLGESCPAQLALEVFFVVRSDLAVPAVVVAVWAGDEDVESSIWRSVLHLHRLWRQGTGDGCDGFKSLRLQACDSSRCRSFLAARRDRNGTPPVPM
jgi:hypothetical protein